MAVPKKKVSRSRRNMRRFAGGNRLAKLTPKICAHCSSVIRPHSVCSYCGHYEQIKILKQSKYSES
jgi:large subunit ribosomal protein L32